MVDPNSSKLEPKILWKDDDLVVVEKPVGLLVDSGGRGDDVVTWAQTTAGFRSAFAFHRLDRETSGLVLLGRTRKYAREITEMFEQKRIRKSYLAVVRGEWPTTLNKVDSPIEDRTAMTTFRRLAVSDSASLIECLPKTGRTHQIRIHCASVGFPILGDTRYGKDGFGFSGHALHAYRLDFHHPGSGANLSIRFEPSEWLTTWLMNFDRREFWQTLFENQQAGEP